MRIAGIRSGIPFVDGEIRVLQIGEGRLLRALIDPIIGELRQKGWNGKIVMTNLRSKGKANIEGMLMQKGRYNVVLMDDQKANAEEINFIAPMDIENDWSRICAISVDPHLSAIISNATERGFQLDKSEFNPVHPSPTFVGTLTKLLHIRFEYKVRVQLSIFPTELIPQNGDTLLENIIAQASFWNLGESFSEWINEFVVFRNTLVDRIVTELRDEGALNFLEASEGYIDRYACLGEKYGKWWIEADRQQLSGFPLYMAPEVELVTDISQYQKMKLWILNGAHLYLACVGLSSGLNTVDQVVNNHDIMKKVHTYWDETKELVGLPEDEVSAFIRDTERRFKQVWLHHRLSDIAVNITEKWKIRLGSFIQEYTMYHGKYSKTVAEMTVAIAEYVSVTEKKTVEEVISSMISNREFLQACLSIFHGENL